MIRIRGSGVVRAVTLVAIRVRDLVIVVYVAGLALDRRVKTRQRKFRCVVIE